MSDTTLFDHAVACHNCTGAQVDFRVSEAGNLYEVPCEPCQSTGVLPIPLTEFYDA
jgi:hypothetical protein